MSDSELVPVDATLVHETDSAVLLDVGQDEPVWVPKSICEEFEDGIWRIQEWYAYKNGLI